MIAENIIQMPLPDPDELPAWVKAALDEWITTSATYYGLDVTRRQYDELNKPHRLQSIENMAFIHLQYLAKRWQFANFRTYVTTFEMDLIEAEIEALQHPYALKRYKHQTIVRDAHGDTHIVTEDDWQHDTVWIVSYIQKRLGRHGKIMGTHQIRRSLEKISAVYEVCEALEQEVAIYDSNIKELRKELRKAS